ncbi:hypothetical protein PG990_002851 [Apiospora arundinis]
METNQVLQQKEFKPFARLPTEMRLAIWGCVASEPRVVTIDTDYWPFHTSPYLEIYGVDYSKAPVLFFVNREARQVALKKYCFRVHLKGLPEVNWLLAEHDRILMKGQWLLATFRSFQWKGHRSLFAPPHHALPGRPQETTSYMVRVSHPTGPHPFGLPSPEEMLSESVAELADPYSRPVRFSLRTLCTADPTDRVPGMVHDTDPLVAIRLKIFHNREPLVAVRIGATNRGLNSSSGGGSIADEEYQMPEVAHVHVDVEKVSDERMPNGTTTP